jgi:hypothetical protein
LKTKDKIKIGVAAYQGHEKAFKVKVPERVRDFFTRGEGFEADGRSFKAAPRGAANQPLGPNGERQELEDTFRVRATVPSWDVQGSLGPCDDAVVEEWKNAGRFLPLFLMGDSRFAVVDLRDSRCPVGLFEEAEAGTKADYVPEIVAPSLDAFLHALIDIDEPSFDIEGEDDLFEEVASAEEEDEEEEDEEED